MDFEYARLLNSTIKLLGMAQLSPDGSRLSVAVSPFIVPRSHPIASTSGSTNIVNISSRNLTSSSYIGPGGGGRFFPCPCRHVRRHHHHHRHHHNHHHYHRH
jgi:homoserine dehydrogenase